MAKGNLNFEIYVDTRETKKAFKELAKAIKAVNDSEIIVRVTDAKPKLWAKIKAFWNKNDIEIAISISIFSFLFSLFYVIYSYYIR